MLVEMGGFYAEIYNSQFAGTELYSQTMKLGQSFI